MLMVGVLAGSGCVRRPSSLPQSFASRPLPPEGVVDLVVLPDAALPSWTVKGRTSTCEAPCAIRVEEGERPVVTASTGEVLELGAMPDDVARARRAVLVPEPDRPALRNAAAVFAALGGIGSLVALLASIGGCALAQQRDPCRGGLLAAAVSVPVMGASVLVMVSSVAGAQLVPVPSSSPVSAVSVEVSPLGLVGRF